MGDKKDYFNFWPQIFLYGGIAFFVSIMGKKITIHIHPEKKAKELLEVFEAPRVKSAHKENFFYYLVDALGPDGLAIEKIEEEVSTFLTKADENGDGKITRREVRLRMKEHNLKKGKESNG